MQQRRESHVMTYWYKVRVSSKGPWDFFVSVLGSNAFFRFFWNWLDLGGLSGQRLRTPGIVTLVILTTEHLSRHDGFWPSSALQCVTWILVWMSGQSLKKNSIHSFQQYKCCLRQLESKYNSLAWLNPYLVGFALLFLSHKPKSRLNSDLLPTADATVTWRFMHK